MGHQLLDWGEFDLFSMDSSLLSLGLASMYSVVYPMPVSVQPSVSHPLICFGTVYAVVTKFLAQRILY
jgi:hypothetical protein